MERCEILIDAWLNRRTRTRCVARTMTHHAAVVQLAHAHVHAHAIACIMRRATCAFTQIAVCAIVRKCHFVMNRSSIQVAYCATVQSHPAETEVHV